MLEVNEIYSLAEKASAAERDSHLFRNFIRLIPKTEIHIHAEATVQFSTYQTLNKKYGINKDLSSENDFKRFLDITSLSQMLEHYIYLQSFFREPEDFLLLARDVQAYAKRNSIMYMELYISPSIVMMKSSIGFDDLLDVLNKGFEAAYREDGIRVAIIIDVSRSFGIDNAFNNLNKLLDYKSRRRDSSRFIGIGLGGAELNNPARLYRDVFRKARENGLHTVAHAGEEVGPESIWEAVNELHAERIGHGTSAILDPLLLKHLKETRLPIEVCPSSNVITRKYVQKLEDHPMKQMFLKGIAVTVNTDDPILFDVELNEEYERVYKSLGFSLKDMLQLIRNNLYATFLSEKEKNAYWLKISSVTEKALKSVYGI